ncbi:hypothetical protein GF312_01810 [Candidatus Poribacteria bacterium]|nr:hypothetical protein [Candidatus Poribacteria bacterium]
MYQFYNVKNISIVVIMKRIHSIMRSLILVLVTSLAFISGCDEDFFGDDEEYEIDPQLYIATHNNLSWSNDGTKLAYILNNKIVIKYIPEDDLKQLTGTGFYSDITWSPDNTRIAYSSRSYGIRDDIWIKDINGDTVANKITSDKAADSHPRWSPTSDIIAFHSFRKTSYDIWIRNASDSGEDLLLVGDTSKDLNPEWSPDGTMLAYQSNKTGNLDLWIIKADFISQPVQFTFHNANDQDPVWSPDGKKIAFESARSGSLGIWVKNSDGSGDAIHISSDHPDSYDANWSADSSRIAYVSDQVIYVRNSDGTDAAQKIHDGLEPRWSPDGKKMAYISFDGKMYGLEIIDAP